MEDVLFSGEWWRGGGMAALYPTPSPSPCRQGTRYWWLVIIDQHTHHTFLSVSKPDNQAVAKKILKSGLIMRSGPARIVIPSIVFYATRSSDDPSRLDLKMFLSSDHGSQQERISRNKCEGGQVSLCLIFYWQF